MGPGYVNYPGAGRMDPATSQRGQKITNDKATLERPRLVCSSKLPPLIDSLREFSSEQAGRFNGQLFSKVEKILASVDGGRKTWEIRGQNINENDDKKRHEIDRHLVEKVICSLCDHEQNVQQVCENCGVCMGEFFCDKCKFFDDDTSKQQYHCDKCGICRTGGRENFFHCDRCGCCYSTQLREGHTCVEKSMHQDCPVSMERYLSKLASAVNRFLTDLEGSDDDSKLNAAANDPSHQPSDIYPDSAKKLLPSVRKVSTTGAGNERRHGTSQLSAAEIVSAPAAAGGQTNCQTTWNPVMDPLSDPITTSPKAGRFNGQLFSKVEKILASVGSEGFGYNDSKLNGAANDPSHQPSDSNPELIRRSVGEVSTTCGGNERPHNTSQLCHAKSEIGAAAAGRLTTDPTTSLLLNPLVDPFITNPERSSRKTWRRKTSEIREQEKRILAVLAFAVKQILPDLGSEGFGYTKAYAAAYEPLHQPSDSNPDRAGEPPGSFVEVVTRCRSILRDFLTTGAGNERRHGTLLSGLAEIVSGASGGEFGLRLGLSSLLSCLGLALHVSNAFAAANDSSHQPSDSNSVAKDVLQSVVKVFTTGAGNQPVYGTGFALKESCVIVTCYHTVHTHEDIHVMFDGGDSCLAKLTVYDEKSDLAILELPPDYAGRLQPLVTASSMDVRYSDEMRIVGHPTNFCPSVLSSTVANPEVNCCIEIAGTNSSIENAIQLEGSCSSGMSGGPVVHANTGVLVGVFCATASEGFSVIGYAIRVEKVLELLKRIRPTMMETD